MTQKLMSLRRKGYFLHFLKSKDIQTGKNKKIVKHKYDKRYLINGETNKVT